MNMYKPAKIMLVEDDSGDQKLIKLSLKSQCISNDIVVAENAEVALEHLDSIRDAQCVDEVPDLILLDLNMPGMGGKEFLRRIKADPDFAIIPVVVLTTSDSESDIIDSFKLQVAGYIQKAVNLEDFRKVMESLGNYWFTVCKRVNDAEPKRTKSECFTC